MELVPVTSKIQQKFWDLEDTGPYRYPDGTIGWTPVDPESGWPGTSTGQRMVYYFRLADGKILEVTVTTYDSYNEGDEYTYHVWKPKGD